MDVPPKEADMKLPFWKKALFSFIVLLILFSVLEIGIRLLPEQKGEGYIDPYLSISEGAPLFIEEKDPSSGSVYMKTAPYKLTFFQEQRFPAKKADGTYRIFSLGGSTTYGRPYNDQTSFSGWLRETLPVADPTKSWEVINAGGVSYASYRVASLMEELAEYEPDLFIVYTGQNEFLEKRTYSDSSMPEQTVQAANELLSHSSIYRLMRKGIDRAKGQAALRSRNETLLPEEVETILEKSIGPADYFRDDPYKLKVAEHFRSNLNRMIQIARSAGAEILFVKPASNLKNCSPFKSQARKGLSVQEMRRWNSLIDQAQVQMQASLGDAALATLDKASEIDSRQALLHYLRGTALYQSGNYPEAKSSFEKALEEDVCPLRAISSISDAVEDVAKSAGTLFVDFEQAVSVNSPHQIPGEEIFIDHVHPTIDGYRLLSIQILDTLSENGIVSLADDWEGDTSLAKIKEKVERSLDPLFHGRALRNLGRIYRWAGKFDEGYRLAKQAEQHLPDDPETLFLIGSNALDTGRIEEAILNLEKSLTSNSEAAQKNILKNLAKAYIAAGMWDKALEAYQKYGALAPEDQTNAGNIAFIQHRKGEYESAISNYELALKANPDNEEALANLGSLYLDQGRLDDARNLFERSLQINPNLYEVVYNMGLVAVLQDKDEEAISHFREAIEINPTAYEAYMEIGDIYLNAGKTTEASKTFGDAIRVNPDAAEAYYFAALSLAQEGRFSEARYMSQQAIKHEPDWTQAVGLAAELALTRQSFSSSAKEEVLTLALEAAKLSEQKDPKILATLTRAYLVNNQISEAKRTALIAKEEAERLGMESLANHITTQFAELLEAKQP